MRVAPATVSIQPSVRFIGRPFSLLQLQQHPSLRWMCDGHIFHFFLKKPINDNHVKPYLVHDVSPAASLVVLVHPTVEEELNPVTQI